MKQTLTRKEFLLMCGSACIGIIGTALVFSKLPKEIETKYILNQLTLIYHKRNS